MSFKILDEDNIKIITEDDRNIELLLLEIAYQLKNIGEILKIK